MTQIKVKDFVLLFTNDVRFIVKDGEKTVEFAGWGSIPNEVREKEIWYCHPIGTALFALYVFKEDTQ